MATRLQVKLDGVERSALVELAEKELREPRDQLRFIIRQELERLGLLPDEDQQSDRGVRLD